LPLCSVRLGFKDISKWASIFIVNSKNYNSSTLLCDSFRLHAHSILLAKHEYTAFSICPK